LRTENSGLWLAGAVMISLSRTFAFASRSPVPRTGDGLPTEPPETFPFEELEADLRQQLQDVQQCQRSRVTPSTRTRPFVLAKPDIASPPPAEAVPTNVGMACEMDVIVQTGSDGQSSGDPPDLSSFDWVTAEEEQQAQTAMRNFDGQQWLQRAVQEQRRVQFRRAARLGLGIAAVVVAAAAAIWILDDPFGFKVVLADPKQLLF
jgi:hypothetical protein